ncbi:MAG: hypothetical protein SFU98_10770 [Leptospiraceae bacterium]|nr:hypothetical protein [Leptospiraceae bacterium]
MPKFGIICEGATDYAVIDNILDGYYQDKHEKSNSLQPLLDATDRQKETGGWELVLNYCRNSEKFKEARLYHDTIIVQIDTDHISEDKDFSGIDTNLEINQLYKVYESRLIQIIGEELITKYRQKIIFAISIHSIECWLLPLFCNLPKEKEHQVNCFNKLERCYKGKIVKTNKFYDSLSKDFRKFKELERASKENSSLGIFMNQLV